MVADTIFRQRVGSGSPGPPSWSEDEGGGGSGWVVLTEVANDIEAHLIGGRLESGGIEHAAVRPPATWVAAGHDPWAPVVIMVRRIQVEDAQLVLAEIAFDAPCAVPLPPGSRSSWKGPVLWWAAALGLGLFFSALSYTGAKETADRCRQNASCNLPGGPADGRK